MKQQFLKVEGSEKTARAAVKMQNYPDAGGGLFSSGKQLQNAQHPRRFLGRHGHVLNVLPAPIVIITDLTACRLSHNPFKSCKSAHALPWSLMCAAFFMNCFNRILSPIRKITKAVASDYALRVEHG
ncbi:MAG: hypothetical protein IH613_02200 [Desulfuromonadales bacterium]|nr:hypothetical protein [Desulfuromonadales bacterium]